MKRRPALKTTLSLVLAVLIGAAGPVAQGQQRDTDARAEFRLGKAAYEQKSFQEALEHFKKSYTLSGEAALLYNIASAQQSLDHPGEAAQSLRDYLTARPQEPDRVEVERRIQALGQAQVIRDREVAQRLALETEAAERQRKQIELDKLRAEPAPGWLTEADAEKRASLAAERERRHRKHVAVGLGAGLGTLAVAGVVIGVVCGLGYCAGAPSKDFDFGKTTVTP